MTAFARIEHCGSLRGPCGYQQRDGPSPASSCQDHGGSGPCHGSWRRRIHHVTRSAVWRAGGTGDDEPVMVMPRAPGLVILRNHPSVTNFELR